MLRFNFILLIIICINTLEASICKADSIKKYKLNRSEKVQGLIERIEKFPSKIVTPRNIDIWFPLDFDKSKRYDVLYVQDGQMLFNSDRTWNGLEWGMDEHMTRLMTNDQIKETIVVGIWSIYRDRNANYFPKKIFESLDDDSKAAMQRICKKRKQSTFINSDRYLKFIVTELKPYIDFNYPTKPDMENTHIMGSSKGALFSIYALCEYPEIFGSAACLSTHWTGTYSGSESNQIPYVIFDYLMVNLPTAGIHRIYFDYGTETLDAKYLPYQDLVNTVFDYKSYDDQSMINLRFDGHEHNEKFWNARLEKPLLFILKESDE